MSDSAIVVQDPRSLSKELAASSLIPQALRKKPEDVWLSS
jgi:hypothetical protein